MNKSLKDKNKTQKNKITDQWIITDADGYTRIIYKTHGGEYYLLMGFFVKNISERHAIKMIKRDS